MNILKIFTILSSILSRVHLVKKKDSITVKSITLQYGKAVDETKTPLSHCDKRTEETHSYKRVKDHYDK